MAIRMSAEAVALYRTLLRHHELVCSPGAPVNACLIFYDKLCNEAGVPHLTRIVGQFLGEVAELCASKGWPPINSLAVNKESRMPGDGYDEAVGCSLFSWADEVRACIDFRRYREVEP